jgi:sporulation protein YlmC with PRC-barrel domain
MILNNILVILCISPSLKYQKKPDTTILHLYETLSNQFIETGVKVLYYKTNFWIYIDSILPAIGSRFYYGKHYVIIPLYFIKGLIILFLSISLMTSGKYFNKGVKALDEPNLGYVVRETPDKIVVFGEKNERYDIPIKEIEQVGANVLIGLNSADLGKYAVPRDAPLPAGRQDPWAEPDKVVDLAAYEGKYPNTLFNKGVRAKNEDHVGHVLKETNDKIVVFGGNNKRFDIPKSEIYQVGMNVIIKIDFPEIFKYEVPKEAPLPTGEPIETVDTDAFPEDYHGPK